MKREDFLDAFKPREKTIEVDGREFRIRSITVAEREEYDELIRANTDKDESHVLRNAREFLVCRGLLDDDGERMFGDADMAAISALDGAVREIGDAIAALSGLTSRKEAVKN